MSWPILFYMLEAMHLWSGWSTRFFKWAKLYSYTYISTHKSPKCLRPFRRLWWAEVKWPREKKTTTRDLEKLESVPNATQYYSILPTQPPETESHSIRVRSGGEGLNSPPSPTQYLMTWVALTRLMEQDHQWWRYHRRLFDYQSPYF